AWSGLSSMELRAGQRHTGGVDADLGTDPDVAAAGRLVGVAAHERHRAEGIPRRADELLRVARAEAAGLRALLVGDGVQPHLRLGTLGQALECDRSIDQHVVTRLEPG